MDPRTPIIVGVGEYSERIGEADYEACSPAELAGRAAREAVADAGGHDLAANIDVVAGIRQFEISRITAVAPFGRADNFPRAVSNRVGADPRLAVLEIAGGQGPQRLVNEFAHRIGTGEAEMVLLAGAEAISTMRALLAEKQKPDWSEVVGGQLEDRGYGNDGLAGEILVRHGATRAVPLYALFENARRARSGLDRDAYRVEMGKLFAPFTKVAEANPHAMSRQAYSPEDIATVTEKNRLICDPFPRRVVSREQANQGAAVLMTSVGKARELGVPEEKWIYLIGGADVKDRPVIERPDLSRSPASVAAFGMAHIGAWMGTDDVALHDLYSCFPIAVFNIADNFDLLDTPNGLTVTGGLPYFGGAGNNYSMHAIAQMVRRLREQPAYVGVVGANGGYMSKYSVGLYTAKPTSWRPFSSEGLQKELDSAEPAPFVEDYAGEGRIETYTIDYAADPAAPKALVVGRTPSGERFVAASEDAAILDHMMRYDPLGLPIKAGPGEGGRNLVMGLG